MSNASCGFKSLNMLGFGSCLYVGKPLNSSVSSGASPSPDGKSAPFSSTSANLTLLFFPFSTLTNFVTSPVKELYKANTVPESGFKACIVFTMF